MIFKSCAWPSEMKEENRAVEISASGAAERKLANVVLRCCPCIFRCRKSVGVDGDLDEEDGENASISTIITTATTPVIALRLSRNSDTVDKATTVSEEEYNVRNKRHFSPEAKNYHVQNSDKEESRYQEFLRSFSVTARERSKSASSSSSNASRSDRQVRGENQDAVLRDYNGNDNSGSSTPRSRDDLAFDIITQQTSQGAVRDDVDSFFTALDTNKAGYPIETTNPSTADEASKEWSSEDDVKPTSRIGSISQHRELIAVDENSNNSTESSFDIPERPKDGGSSARRRSIITVIPNERILPYESPKISEESIQSHAASSKRSDSLYQTPNHSAHHSPSKRNSRCNSRDLIEASRDFSEEGILASIVLDEDASIRSMDTVDHPPVDMTGDSPAIIIASRPHSSHDTVDYVQNVGSANLRNKITTQESTEEESSVTLEDKQSKDSASETNTEPGILKIEPQSVESIESRRRLPSKVPVRDVNYRAPSRKRTAEKPTEKSKRMVQQCFAQLENKDWEVTMKGLKALSHISKQQPECLDVSAAGTIGRLLGRHIKNLRSQVARAACLAAGDVFSSQIRGIDQDLDDIAGPLLHRTADTNRFLRADSNAALDQMVQHLPPHKTIGIIVLRGASHQNAIVRAATARLLSDITDRIGPDHIMILPRDVKDKLLNAGAKLLMDGNLDARNYAKRMFRRLTRCEGFRKALTDAVPDTTLRHIDKTMKTL